MGSLTETRMDIFFIIMIGYNHCGMSRRIKMIDIEDTRVQVYWNFHKECWSVVALQGEHKGRVVKHTDSIVIKDATFVVQTCWT